MVTAGMSPARNTGVRLTGRLSTNSASSTPWRPTLCRSTTGVSPVTVMVSSSALTCNVVFTVATNVPLNSTPSCLTVLNPGRTKVTV